MGYFYHLVAGANLVDKKKVHFTLVQHRLPFQASVYTGDRGRNGRPDSGILQHRVMQKILIKNWIYMLDIYRLHWCVDRNNIDTFRQPEIPSGQFYICSIYISVLYTLFFIYTFLCIRVGCVGCSPPEIELVTESRDQEFSEVPNVYRKKIDTSEVCLGSPGFLE